MAHSLNWAMKLGRKWMWSSPSTDSRSCGHDTRDHLSPHSTKIKRYYTSEPIALPLELWLHIFRLAVGPSPLVNLRSRYVSPVDAYCETHRFAIKNKEEDATKRAITLVNKAWNEIGTVLLYETVVLLHPDQLRALSRSLETYPYDRGCHIRALFINFGTSGANFSGRSYSHELETVLRFSTRLSMYEVFSYSSWQDLGVHALRPLMPSSHCSIRSLSLKITYCEVPPMDLCEFILTWCNTLESLHLELSLSRCRLMNWRPYPKLHLPQLHTLSISGSPTVIESIALCWDLPKLTWIDASSPLLFSILCGCGVYPGVRTYSSTLLERRDDSTSAGAASTAALLPQGEEVIFARGFKSLALSTNSCQRIGVVIREIIDMEDRLDSVLGFAMKPEIFPMLSTVRVTFMRLATSIHSHIDGTDPKQPYWVYDRNDIQSIPEVLTQPKCRILLAYWHRQLALRGVSLQAVEEGRGEVDLDWEEMRYSDEKLSDKFRRWWRRPEVDPAQDFWARQYDLDGRV